MLQSALIGAYKYSVDLRQVIEKATILTHNKDD